MKITIKNEIVRKNIELFQKLVQRQALKESAKEEILVHALVHRKTGNIRFLDKDTASLEGEWKPICIRIHASLKEGVFEVVEEKDMSAFQCTDLQPLAYAIMVETIHTLNQLIGQEPNAAHAGVLLDSFAHCEILATDAAMLKDLIHDAWHQTDRLGAEDLLSGCAIGTFLFRKDEYASLLEEELRPEFGQDLTCFTLTYVENSEKIIDRTIVKWKDKWLFYDDDPTLSGHSFPSVYELLGTLKKHLKDPLLY